MLQPSLTKNDSKAKIFIWAFSIIVFVAVAILSKVKLNVNLPFNVHVFATFNAIVNSLVALLLLTGLITAKNKNYKTHKKIMLSANVGSDVKSVFWYVNNKLLTKAASKSPVFYEPDEGKVKISCSDDKGRNTDIEIEVIPVFRIWTPRAN